MYNLKYVQKLYPQLAIRTAVFIVQLLWLTWPRNSAGLLELGCGPASLPIPFSNSRMYSSVFWSSISNLRAIQQCSVHLVVSRESAWHWASDQDLGHFGAQARLEVTDWKLLQWKSRQKFIYSLSVIVWP